MPATMDIIGFVVYGDTFGSTAFFQAKVLEVPIRIFFPNVLTNLLNHEIFIFNRFFLFLMQQVNYGS